MPFTLNTFKVFEDEFQSGVTEVLMQNSEAFNGASANTINIVPSLHRGNFASEAFFLEIEDLIRERNPATQVDESDDDLEQGELIMPKVNRKYQVLKTLDAFRKILPQDNPESVFSTLLGQQVGKSVLVDYLNTAIAGLVGAVDGNADVQHDATDGVIAYTDLVTGLSKYGDAGNNISAWLMHSKAYYDLLGESVGIATDRVGGAAIYEGTAGTLGRPVVVTDSPFLTYESTGTKYRTFGLTANALSVIESEGGIMTPINDIVTGKTNLAMRVQGEHAYNLRVRGYSYTNATANPANTALANDANWTKVSTSNKSTAGVLINSQ